MTDEKKLEKLSKQMLKHLDKKIKARENLEASRLVDPLAASSRFKPMSQAWFNKWDDLNNQMLELRFKIYGEIAGSSEAE